MPKRTDIASILLIGSGPIVIGQACEFDYSGTQACKALKEEGYRVILVNSNPATIMTDPEFADRTYIEPLTVEHLTAIIAAERPDALLPTMGGQTALNLALALHDAGVLQQYGVRLIGANVDAIRKAEDRLLFKEAMARIGLQVPASVYVSTPDEGRTALETIGLPAIIRPAFTLGGSGGSIAHTLDEFEQAVAFGLAQSPVHRVLLETSVLGWKEYELEVVRDTADNVVIICSIENFDPMGVHTGDSITVAPAQTLTDKEYQQMRDAAIAIMREIGVETGGSNVQFAVNPADGALVVVEMNPRVSRSSALASKATGYPIAKIAAKLAVGYRLDELRNDITRTTSAAFEPVIDYVVTKVPRFTFEKFPTTEALLTTQMKSVGEVMAIGRTFPESLHKAIRSLEQGVSGLIHPHIRDGERLLPQLVELLQSPRPDRLWWIAEALRCGLGIDEITAHCHVDPWFLYQMRLLIEMEENLRATGLQPETLAQAKRLGFADAQIAEVCAVPESAVRAAREHAGLHPTYRAVDTCAAEFEAFTPYLYSTYDGSETPESSPARVDDECPPTARRKVIILGSGPNRIGQGIEFDYCCVQAVFALRAAGVEAIMINCNPETVSTDYDTADRLYFEPLTTEDVLAIIRREQPEGVIVQFGGQTPLKLVAPLVAAGVTILGTAPAAIECAEDREQFSALLHRLGLVQPPAGSARTIAQAEAIADRLGFPVLVRPSFVLGGRAMRIITDAAALRSYWHEAIAAAPEHPVLIDRYIENAIEVDVDALCDGHDATVVGMMEHIEEAGVHSGDSSCVLPPYSLTASVMEQIAAQTRALALALRVVGLLNVQFAVHGETIYVLEANPRASRTVPFVAKVVGRPIAQYATRLMLGERLCDVCPAMPAVRHFGVKSPVFPFLKFPGVDPQLGPEMRSTGEVMGIDATVAGAFVRAQTAAGNRLPRTGTVFVSVRDADKTAAAEVAAELLAAGFQVVATSGTARYCAERGLAVTPVRKVAEGSPHIVDHLREGEIAMVINTTMNDATVLADSFSIRRTTIELGLPYFTTIAAARAAAAALATTAHASAPTVTPLQVWHGTATSQRKRAAKA